MNIAADLVLSTFPNVEFFTQRADVARVLSRVNMEDSNIFPAQKIVGRDVNTGELFLFLKKGSNRYRLDPSETISAIFSSCEEVRTYILYFSPRPFSGFVEKLRMFSQEKDQVKDDHIGWLKHSFTRPEIEKDFFKRELTARQESGCWTPLPRHDKNVQVLTVFGNKVKQVYANKLLE